ncbi:putative transmembrane protein [Gregarina niphandrodes]|uniref:Transmembrane protein n=1 Tax=Gregarina niphandrodes TaxID=110365 RepID=A0A023BDM6_GRENI|nr:putative transmembrane protein [Gregarina niphandrodes]EZG88181.1 putative transmembrane protein [Gregarina niphandrodes]|eukprot:XP_011128605.1 putative transmembrane protein [Gregarina niphandrodes]
MFMEQTEESHFKDWKLVAPSKKNFSPAGVSDTADVPDPAATGNARQPKDELEDELEGIGGSDPLTDPAASQDWRDGPPLESFAGKRTWTRSSGLSGLNAPWVRMGTLGIAANLLGSAFISQLISAMSPKTTGTIGSLLFTLGWALILAEGGRMFMYLGVFCLGLVFCFTLSAHLQLSRWFSPASNLVFDLLSVTCDLSTLVPWFLLTTFYPESQPHSPLYVQVYSQSLISSPLQDSDSKIYSGGLVGQMDSTGGPALEPDMWSRVMEVFFGIQWSSGRCILIGAMLLVSLVHFFMLPKRSFEQLLSMDERRQLRNQPAREGRFSSCMVRMRVFRRMAEKYYSGPVNKHYHQSLASNVSSLIYWMLLISFCVRIVVKVHMLVAFPVIYAELAPFWVWINAFSFLGTVPMARIAAKTTPIFLSRMVTLLQPLALLTLLYPCTACGYLGLLTWPFWNNVPFSHLYLALQEYLNPLHFPVLQCLCLSCAALSVLLYPLLLAGVSSVLATRILLGVSLALLCSTVHERYYVLQERRSSRAAWRRRNRHRTRGASLSDDDRPSDEPFLLNRIIAHIPDWLLPRNDLFCEPGFPDEGPSDPDPREHDDDGYEGAGYDGLEHDRAEYSVLLPDQDDADGGWEDEDSSRLLRGSRRISDLVYHPERHREGSDEEDVMSAASVSLDFTESEYEAPDAQVVAQLHCDKRRVGGVLAGLGLGAVSLGKADLEGALDVLSLPSLVRGTEPVSENDLQRASAIIRRVSRTTDRRRSIGSSVSSARLAPHTRVRQTNNALWNEEQTPLQPKHRTPSPSPPSQPSPNFRPEYDPVPLASCSSSDVEPIRWNDALRYRTTSSSSNTTQKENPPTDSDASSEPPSHFPPSATAPRITPSTTKTPAPSPSLPPSPMVTATPGGSPAPPAGRSPPIATSPSPTPHPPPGPSPSLATSPTVTASPAASPAQPAGRSPSVAASPSPTPHPSPGPSPSLATSPAVTASPATSPAPPAGRSPSVAASPSPTPHPSPGLVLR